MGRPVRPVPESLLSFGMLFSQVSHQYFILLPHVQYFRNKVPNKLATGYITDYMLKRDCSGGLARSNLILPLTKAMKT